jgi:hypothetical protein
MSERLRTFVYWHRFQSLPVTLHLTRDRRFSWTRIYGVQVGPWFIGAIRGTEVRNE